MFKLTSSLSPPVVDVSLLAKDAAQLTALTRSARSVDQVRVRCGGHLGAAPADPVVSSAMYGSGGIMNVHRLSIPCWSFRLAIKHSSIQPQKGSSPGQ